MHIGSGPGSRAWFTAPVERFLLTSSDEILGHLVGQAGYAVLTTQTQAWLTQVDILRTLLRDESGTLILEFSIPRMGRRIDAVVLTRGIVVVLEFKVGSSTFDGGSLDQVWDYALDLKNFHRGSHDLRIAPVLVATAAEDPDPEPLHLDADGVYRPVPVSARTLPVVFRRLVMDSPAFTIDPKAWLAAPYSPTPTIIEAARALYAQHSVENIARHDAGAANLRVTSQRLDALVDEASAEKRKLICFVTGVPGAGKTLVGLNLATRRREDHPQMPAVYLSGNGPLVAVLREALTRDEVARQQELGLKARKSRIGESVKAFIQNVHHFRDDALLDTAPPAEHVAIFDEAQRAWTLEQTASFMRRKKHVEGFSQSEPQFLVGYLDRHRDWAVVVCLVGGGQEINTGEAGIDSWLEAAREQFPDWRMHISSRLLETEYAAGAAVDQARRRPNTVLDDCLHLSVSMRSFRSEKVSAFVKALLDRDSRQAGQLRDEVSDRYPIVVTRDLEAARDWVRGQSRGSERYGLVASSKALRLKPHAVDVRVDIDPVHWFLNGKEDTRSSFYLEDAATEFQVQGLELDWTCVTWDADLRFQGEGWGFHDFRGARWTNVNRPEGRRYLLNAYRVLLTRARQGMVIFIPPGHRRDATGPPEYYDSTYQYLRDVGVPALR